MNTTAPSVQADISEALVNLFRGFVRAATSSITPTEGLVLSWVSDIHHLRQCLDRLEAGVNLGAAFKAAVNALTNHKPQSRQIEAQLDLGLMGVRHLIELASTEPMAKSRTATSERNLRGAVAWLDTVRGSSSPVSKPLQTKPSPVPNPLSEEQAKAETDLAMEIAVLFREAMRSMSANDRRGPLNQVLFSYNACRNLAGRIGHSYYFDPILQRAIDQFNAPEELTKLESARLDLARAGVRLLATRTDPNTRRPGYASRLARDATNFDNHLASLNDILAR